jgi:uncharacterized tellurite resistance protein B-like protein
MLRALQTFFGGGAVPGGAGGREQELRLATAVLLVEVARADFAEDLPEIEAVARLLEQHLGLARGDIDALVAEAGVAADRQASLQAITRQLHEDLGTEEKLKVVEMLWRVALSDARLDKHEDHLIRKIAGLLYVSHSDLIRIRNRVADRG